MSKLNQEELLRWLEQAHRYFTFEPPGKDEQAYKQIREMIQKPEVTEEFITEKAKLFVYAIMPSDIEPTRSDIHAAKEFLRSLFKEMGWMEESGCS